MSPVVAQADERAERLLEPEVRVGPVQEQEVEAVDLQVLERLLGRAAGDVRRVLLARDLGREEELLSRHAGRGQPAPDLLLVAVGARGVDVPVADRERVLDCLLALGPLDLPGAEAELGDGRALDLEGAHGCVDRGHPGPVPIPARLLAFPAFPGRLAQLGERRLDKAEVTGSSPVSPTEKARVLMMSIRPL